jgi:hypothetical protein
MACYLRADRFVFLIDFFSPYTWQITWQIEAGDIAPDFIPAPAQGPVFCDRTLQG